MQATSELDLTVRLRLLYLQQAHPGRHLSCVVYSDDDNGRAMAEMVMYRWRWHNWVTRAQRDAAIYRIYCAKPTGEKFMLSMVGWVR